MTETPVFSVSEITEQIRSTLEQNWSRIRIRGECSNVTYHRSGHIYFVLKDAGAELRCIMFKGYASHLRFKLDEGVEVIASGSITVFVQRGQLQCVVTALQPAGQGNLYLLYEQLKRALSEEGLFDETRKMPLPVFPTRIGVLTSDTGAAVRDIFQVLERRAPYVKLIHRPTLVQGPNSADDIVRGLNQMEQAKPDLIILGRGGGSIEDLWSFNEEKVARAISACPIPIISAVGHETDITIADLVADLRAPTPSAAAELAAPSTGELLQRLQNDGERLERAVKRKLQVVWQTLDHWEQRLEAQVPRKQLKVKRELIHTWQERLWQAWRNQDKNLKLQLSRYQNSLSVLNPAQVLERGYALALKPDTDQVIQSVSQVDAGEAFRVRLKDGEFPAKRTGEHEQEEIRWPRKKN